MCCYLVNVENSPLYSRDDKTSRARVDQWLAFFTNHLGRWMNNYAFEQVARVKLGFGEPNKDIEQEAYGFVMELGGTQKGISTVWAQRLCSKTLNLYLNNNPSCTKPGKNCIFSDLPAE